MKGHVPKFFEVHHLLEEIINGIDGPCVYGDVVDAVKRGIFIRWGREFFKHGDFIILSFDFQEGEL